MARSDSQRYPWNLFRLNEVKDIFVFLGLKVFIYVNFYNFYMFSCSKNAQVTFVEISNRYLIKQNLERNCFESDIAIFELRVTWNFGNKPLNLSVFDLKSLMSVYNIKPFKHFSTTVPLMFNWKIKSETFSILTFC